MHVYRSLHGQLHVMIPYAKLATVFYETLGQMRPLVLRFNEVPVGTVQPNSDMLLHARIKVTLVCIRHNAMRRYERDNLQLRTSLTSVLMSGSFRAPVSLYPRKVSPLSFNTCLDGLNGLEKNKTL